MITPHINAKKGDFSELVIMSGDPIRVKYIAQSYLKCYREITNIRSMLGFTGYYKDIMVSVMSHGMGIPSAAIYTTELIKNYNVKKIIRVGTCGTLKKDIKLKDIIIAMGACTDSNFNRSQFNNFDFSSIANFNMIYNSIKISKSMNINVKIGNFFTTDLFYSSHDKILNLLNKYNILGIDMETAGIYSIASKFNIHAMSICSVTDHIKYKTLLSSEERSNSLNNTIKIALETIIL